MKAKYWCPQRPPTYGAVPRGSTAMEQFIPAHAVEGVPASWLFGWVEHDHALLFDTVRQYELLPDGRIERTAYLMWERAGYDAQCALEMLAQAFEEMHQFPAEYKEAAKDNEFLQLAAEWHAAEKHPSDLTAVFLARVLRFGPAL